MLDRDLAVIYGVETKVLNQAVKRNMERFPQEFRFQLTQSEDQQLATNWERLDLRSQVVTSNTRQWNGTNCCASGAAEPILGVCERPPLRPFRRADAITSHTETMPLMVVKNGRFWRFF